MVRIAISSALALFSLIPSSGLAGSAVSSANDYETAAFTQYNAARLKLAGVKATPGGDPTIDTSHV